VAEPGVTDSTVTVRPADPAEMPALRALRRDVFADEQGIAAELITDEHDADAVHIVAIRDGELIGTGRLVAGSSESSTSAESAASAGSAGKIGRLATRPADRGAGVGAAVMRELERQARDRGLAEVRLHALDSARSFYDRIGYRACGEVFLEAGRAHIAMRKPLPVLR